MNKVGVPGFDYLLRMLLNIQLPCFLVFSELSLAVLT